MKPTVAKLAAAGFNIQLEHVWEANFRHVVSLLDPYRIPILAIAGFTQRDPPLRGQSALGDKAQTQRRKAAEQALLDAAIAARSKGFHPPPPPADTSHDPSDNSRAARADWMRLLRRRLQPSSPRVPWGVLGPPRVQPSAGAGTDKAKGSHGGSPMEAKAAGDDERTSTLLNLLRRLRAGGPHQVTPMVPHLVQANSPQLVQAATNLNLALS